MQPIEAIDALELGNGLKLKLNLSPAKVSWQQHFQVYLEKNAKLSAAPVLHGIYSTGSPSLGARGWMDLNYRSIVPLEHANVHLSASAAELKLFEALGTAIPEGGSMMIAYRMFVGEEEIHRNTRDALDAGIPPVLTPLGRLLFWADCGWRFRDWYIAEGGREGPEKLQGFKLESQEDRPTSAATLAATLHSFIAESPPDSSLHAAAHRIAIELMPKLNEWVGRRVS